MTMETWRFSYLESFFNIWIIIWQAKSRILVVFIYVTLSTSSAKKSHQCDVEKFQVIPSSFDGTQNIKKLALDVDDGLGYEPWHDWPLLVRSGVWGLR